MTRKIRDRNSVLRACADYDRVGQERFLSEHGFGVATRYLLRVDGRLYDSKAIAGVAYGFENPGEGTLDASSFSGGVSAGAAAWQLKQLGFEVVERDAG